MKAKKQFWVIAYDIVDDRNRNRIASFLEKHGQRVNYSVFECMLTDSQFEKVKKQIEKWMDTDDDRIVYYPICVNCYTKIIYEPDLRKKFNLVQQI